MPLSKKSNEIIYFLPNEITMSVVRNIESNIRKSLKYLGSVIETNVGTYDQKSPKIIETISKIVKCFYNKPSRIFDYSGVKEMAQSAQLSPIHFDML